MPKGSIAARLFWLSAVWLVVALAATALMLSELYSRSLDRSLIDSLNFNLETLVARTLEAGTPEAELVTAADPRFQRPASGWYWQISAADGRLLNLSGSLIGSIMPTTDVPFDDLNTRTDTVEDGFGIRLRLIQRRINTAGEDYVFSVTGNLDDISEQTGIFRRQALFVLVAVGAMLAIMSALVARVALRPVGQLREEIELVREGEVKNISDEYPRELTPLAGELNALLRSNAEIVERARSHVGNLAHGLKTPLAVLQNEAATERSNLAKTVLDEVGRMSSMVSNYLERARLSARTAVVGQRTDANAVFVRVVRVMSRLHPEKEVELKSTGDSALWFRGEAGDLEEIAGNLLDNACKWSRSRVEVELARDTNGPFPQVRITIADDGPGLTQDERQKVVRRGVRLDEKVPGSGLGLDIVKELVEVYGGSLNLSDADLGGLQVEMFLPAAKSPS